MSRYLMELESRVKPVTQNAKLNRIKQGGGFPNCKARQAPIDARKLTPVDPPWFRT